MNCIGQPLARSLPAEEDGDMKRLLGYERPLLGEELAYIKLNIQTASRHLRLFRSIREGRLKALSFWPLRFAFGDGCDLSSRGAKPCGFDRSYQARVSTFDRLRRVSYGGLVFQLAVDLASP